MSNDKIDITCPYCHTVLRVDAIHAGKKLRCPSCNSITLIPGGQGNINPTAYSATPEPTHQAKPPQNPVPAEPGDHRYYSPQEPQASEYAARPRDHQGNYARPYTIQSDGGDSSSLALGIIGIVLNFFCSCLLPGIVIMNVIGFIKGYHSTGPLRKAGMITNGISLGISFLWLLVFAAQIAIF